MSTPANISCNIFLYLYVIHFALLLFSFLDKSRSETLDVFGWLDRGTLSTYTMLFVRPGEN